MRAENFSEVLQASHHKTQLNFFFKNKLPVMFLLPKRISYSEDFISSQMLKL